MPAPPAGSVEDVVDVAAAKEGFKETAKDLFSGACGGIAQVLLGRYSSVSVVLKQAPRNIRSQPFI